MHRAVLEFSVDTVLTAATVAVYPAKPFIMTIPDRGTLPWEYLIDNRPRGIVTFDGMRGQAEITDLYQTYLGKKVFPAGRYFLEEENPNLILAVQPEAHTQPGTFRLLTTDATDDRRPLLKLLFHPPVNGLCSRAPN